MNKLEKLKKLSAVISKLEIKTEYFGQLYASAEANGDIENANAYYRSRKYAREGLKMAKVEFAKTQREYKREMITL